MELVSVMLEENSRRTIRRALISGELKAAIIPLGSTEQHNEHLAMNHDTRSVLFVAKAVAERLQPSVVVTPPLAIGVSEHWMDHKGTLTMSADTFCRALFEICDSLQRHEFRHVLVLNGHGGNTRPVRERLEDFRSRLKMNLDFCCYWDAYPKDLVQRYMESGECPGHAAEFETSFALAAFSENVHFVDEPYPTDELTIRHTDQADVDRRFHRDARLATAEKGGPMIQAAIDWVAERLHRSLNEVMLGTRPCVD